MRRFLSSYFYKTTWIFKFLSVTTSLFRLYQGDTPPNLKNNQLVKVQLGLNKKNAFIKVNERMLLILKKGIMIRLDNEHKFFKVKTVDNLTVEDVNSFIKTPLKKSGPFIIVLFKSVLRNLDDTVKLALIRLGSSKIFMASSNEKAWMMIGFLKTSFSTSLEAFIPQSEENLIMDFFPGIDEISVRKYSFAKLCATEPLAKAQFTMQVCEEGFPPAIPLTDQSFARVPVAILASERIDYLIRCVYNLHRASGGNLDNIYILVDGFYQEVLYIAQIFGVRVVFFPALREHFYYIEDVITAHVKRCWKFIFSDSSVQFGIILEEDLLVAPDFFSYFSQLIPAVEKDSSLFCASAWNDNGYIHTTSDPARLYRTNFFPGLGYLFPRRSWDLVKNEMADHAGGFDWWLRRFMSSFGFECVIPDFSRTFHFGQKGSFMKKEYHNEYFIHHRFNTISDVQLKNVDRLEKNLYEMDLINELKSAIPIKTSSDPCVVGYKNFIPDTKGKTYVIWLAANHQPPEEPQAFLLNCWGMMENNVRGLHNGILSFYIKDNFVMVISEISSYAYLYKPKALPAIHISKADHFFPEEFKHLISLPENLTYYNESFLS